MKIVLLKSLSRFGEVYRGNWHGEDVAIKKFTSWDACSAWKRECEVFFLFHVKICVLVCTLTAKNERGRQ